MNVLIPRTLLVMLFAAWSALALAAPQVSLTVTAEKEVEVTGADGKTVRQRVAADTAEPGDLLFYTIEYRNSGDEPARNVKLDNPVPDGAAYIADSAFADNAEILFSVDGEVFKKPGSLTYEIKAADGKTESRKADAEQYRAIRWVVSEIAAGAGGKAGFAVRIQ